MLSLLATGRFELQGRTPYEAIMNYTPDIPNSHPLLGINGVGILMSPRNQNVSVDG